MKLRQIILFLANISLISCGVLNSDNSGNFPISYYRFYASAPASSTSSGLGDLWGIDLTHPTNPAKLDTGVSTLRGNYFVYYKVSNNAINSNPQQTILYIKSGIIYKIGYTNADPLIPTQLSNESNALPYCSIKMRTDLLNFENSVFLYSLPTTGNICIYKIIKLGMSSTDSPLPVPPNIVPVESLTDTISGAIIGWLATSGSNILRCDINFQSCSTINGITFTQFVSSLSPNFTSEFRMIEVDSVLYSYNMSTGSISAPLYTFTRNTSYFPGLEDNTYFYFSDGGSLFKVPLNGSGSAVLLINESSGQNPAILYGYLTDKNIVYQLVTGLNPSLNFSIKSISKNGEPAISLSASNNLQIAYLTVGNWVYYSLYSDTNGFEAISVRDDGTSQRIIQNSHFAGNIFENSNANVLRIDGCSQSSCAGGMLWSFTGATNSGNFFLGTLPIDTTDIFFFGNSSSAIGSGYQLPTPNNLFGVDIFYINVNQRNSLTRVTTNSFSLPIY